MFSAVDFTFSCASLCHKLIIIHFLILLLSGYFCKLCNKIFGGLQIMLSLSLKFIFDKNSKNTINCHKNIAGNAQNFCILKDHLCMIFHFLILQIILKIFHEIRPICKLYSLTKLRLIWISQKNHLG